MMMNGNPDLYLEQIGQKAKDASTILMKTQTALKNRVLKDAADALISRTPEILG